MKYKRILYFLFFYIAFSCISACTFAPYNESFTITGTIEKFITEENFFIDDQFLSIKEYGGESEGRGQGNMYEIPVDNFKDYEVGQRVEVVVFSNTDTDDWDLDNLKFEITIIE